MKGYAAAAASPLAKRRWKGFAFTVITLVVSSLLVPLVFIFGLQSRLPSGNPVYLSDDGSTSVFGVKNFSKTDGLRHPSAAEGVQGTQKDTSGYVQKEGSEKAFGDHKKLPSPSTKVRGSSSGFGKRLARNDETEIVFTSGSNKIMLRNDNENEKICQHQFGSYCFWSKEHKVAMKDSMVKNLKDQLFVARAYYPIIIKHKSQEKLSYELKQSIQDHERMLSVSLVDADLPLDVKKKIKRMEVILNRGKSLHMNCNYVNQKLGQILDLTEDEAHFHMRQSAFLHHLGVQTVPKSLHCLSMRLTVEYFESLSDADNSHSEKLANPSLQHYVIFSRNILASAVVINSTVMNAKESENLVFHLLTNGQHYFAMKFWFLKNSYKGTVVHVENIDGYGLDTSYGVVMPPSDSMSEEFQISIPNIHQLSTLPTIEYISVFGHAYFLLPKIFKKLRRLIILGDDVVVQQDLSLLWNLDLKGKVIGAVEFCKVQLGQLKSYLVGMKYDKEVCTWISGLNVVDLDKWRELNVSEIHQQLLSKHMKLRKQTLISWRTAALPTSFLAFHRLVYPLNNSWILSGLGTKYGISRDYVRNAPVLQYNGNMKPWLQLGISKYKKYWRYYLTRGNFFMDECNVNP